MTRLELILRELPPVRFVRETAKRITIPGTGKLSLYEIGDFFFSELKNNKLNMRSSAVTFSFLMAIPPTLLFLFSLVPYLPLHGVKDTILETLRLVTPNNDIYIALSSFVIDLMDKERGGVLSFGFLLVMYYSSNGMMGLLQSFEKSSHIYVKRSPFKKRWIAVKLTFMLIGVTLLTIGVLILQSAELNDLLLSLFDNVIIVRITSLLIIVAIIFSTISVIYKYGPSLSSRSNFVSPGSVLATTMLVLTTAVFFFLVNNFVNYNKLYGSIGTLFAFMVLLRMNTFIILVGYELNVSILLAKTSKKENVLET